MRFPVLNPRLRIVQRPGGADPFVPCRLVVAAQLQEGETKLDPIPLAVMPSAQQAGDVIVILTHDAPPRYRRGRDHRFGGRVNVPALARGIRPPRKEKEDYIFSNSLLRIRHDSDMPPHCRQGQLL